MFVLALITACDQVKEPIPPAGPGGPGGGGEFVRRRVLLEDFTGHKCNNCPAAASTAQQLQSNFPGDVVVVGIHTTETFAAPQPGPNNSYTTDFRTPAGDAYEEAFDISWLPAGMVNRKEFNSSQIMSHNAWGTAVNEMVGLPASFDVWFDQLQHNAGSNTVTAEVKIAVLEPVVGAHNVTIYLTEDHVIDWQYDAQSADPNVPDYDHRHVLRTNLNGPWGQQLISASAGAGDTLTLSYSDFPVSAEWNASNCALVAYIYSTATDEVLQVVEQKFYP